MRPPRGRSRDSGADYPENEVSLGGAVKQRTSRSSYDHVVLNSTIRKPPPTAALRRGAGWGWLQASVQAGLEFCTGVTDDAIARVEVITVQKDGGAGPRKKQAIMLDRRVPRDLLTASTKRSQASGTSSISSGFWSGLLRFREATLYLYADTGSSRI
jgi:hypothetical protein